MVNLEFVSPTLRQPVQFCIFNIIWTFVLAELTGNVSQVDRVWTFLPTLYTTYFAFAPAFSFAPEEVKKLGISDRAVLMFILQFLWMLRLSYNTWRRGLFNLKDEDYRWELLRKDIKGIWWTIFNLGFIAGAQNVLLFTLGLPAHTALTQRNQGIYITDVAMALVSIIVLLIEFTADNQQWSFQNYKRTGVIDRDSWVGARIQWTEEDRKRGFITRGLWAWSRHPNFACEQSFWILMTTFPIVSSPSTPGVSLDTLLSFWLPSLLPAILLVILFFSSTIFSESITASKYPAYAAYQRRVGMFLPTEVFFRRLILTVLGEREKVDQQLWGGSKSKKE